MTNAERRTPMTETKERRKGRENEVNVERKKKVRALFLFSIFRFELVVLDPKDTEHHSQNAALNFETIHCC
jgi:hypothetical protein